MPSTDPADAGATRSQTLALAVMFGLVSIPWTYSFGQAAGLPLWPAFIASATYFSAGTGPRDLARGLAGNLAGAVYAVATLALVSMAGAGLATLSLAVGVGMFIASLHPFVPGLTFTPAAFFGYATAFSVHAADVQLAVAGLGGELVATAASMAIGAAIGLAADLLSQHLAHRSGGLDA